MVLRSKSAINQFLWFSLEALHKAVPFQNIDQAKTTAIKTEGDWRLLNKFTSLL